LASAHAAAAAAAGMPRRDETNRSWSVSQLRGKSLRVVGILCQPTGCRLVGNRDGLAKKATFLTAAGRVLIMREGCIDGLMIRLGAGDVASPSDSGNVFLFCFGGSSRLSSILTRFGFAVANSSLPFPASAPLSLFVFLLLARSCLARQAAATG
jgi:hypothetical protein